MTKTLTSYAAAAAAIREELKKAFPETKFKVTSKGFSMGNAVDISWTDGPCTGAVEAITSKYQYGSFDGSIDLYEYDNRREDIPQAKYVSEYRRISTGLAEKVAGILNIKYGFDIVVTESQWGGWTTNREDTRLFPDWGTGSELISRELHEKSADEVGKEEE